MPTLTSLTSQRVLDDSMTVLQAHIPLQATGYRCQSADLWRVLLAATAQHRSIQAACADLDGAPHPNTIRGYLAQQWQPDQLPTLQQQCNAALHAALPDWLTSQPQEIAIDTHDMPFYGRIKDTAAEQWVCGGKAKASTTWHDRCATATVLTPQARLTIALMFVQPGTTMDAIVAQLLATIQASGITIGCLYADRGFATVAVLQRLQQAQIPAIVALAERGPRLRAQCQGRESRWVQHTLTRRTAGSMTVKVAVVRTFRRTKRRRRRAAWCLFVCLGIRDSLIGIRQRYRARFGIESSYRQLEALRIRTTSLNPALRLMVVGIALVLLNVWVWVHWQYLRWPGRGPRRVDRGQFTLRRFQTFLLAAITAIYGQTTQLMLAPYRSCSLVRSNL